MLFVAEYEFGWESMPSVMAKRMEWPEMQPEGFRFVGEYIWTDREPPFRGIAVIEAADATALNAFALHYGPTLKMAIHPASDVMSGIAALSAGSAASEPARRRANKR